jgi:hypothetical protein
MAQLNVAGPRIRTGRAAQCGDQQNSEWKQADNEADGEPANNKHPMLHQTKSSV